MAVRRHQLVSLLAPGPALALKLEGAVVRRLEQGNVALFEERHEKHAGNKAADMREERDSALVGR
jgi:hypothetical protein